MAMSENTKKVIKFLQENASGNFTAKDVAAKLDMSDKTVNGCFTSGIQRKDFGYRQEVEVELSDGTHQKVKLLKLNDAGMAVDTDAVEG